MVNIELLYSIIKEKGMTIEEVANGINIDKSTLYRKFKAKGIGFTVEEANKIVSLLGLSATIATKIFFANSRINAT